MESVLATLFVLCSLFALHFCAPFTDGNLLVTYARGAFTENQMPASFAEVTKEGTIVQTFDVPQADFTFSGYIYVNGPNLAVKKDFAAFNAGSINSDRPPVVLAADGTYQVLGICCTTNDLRSFYHDGGVYTAGKAGILGYAPIGSTRTILATVGDLYDVFVFEDQLYATNYDGNNFFLAKVGNGVPTNSGNSLTTVVPTGLFSGYNSQFTFYRKDETLFLYVSTESPHTIRKLVFQNNAWAVAYSADLPNIAVSQVAFETGDGTTTLLVTVIRDGIYKTIDDGTGFSTPTKWLAGSDQVDYKGISFAPTTCYNGVMDGTETGIDCGGAYCQVCPPQAPVSAPVAVPVSAPVAVPVSTPVTDAPIDSPVSEPVSSTPIDTPIDAPLAGPAAGPTAGPTAGPLASPVSAPQSANTPTVSSGLVSAQIGACTVFALAALLV